eukprot:115334_1
MYSKLNIMSSLLALIIVMILTANTTVYSTHYSHQQTRSHSNIQRHTAIQRLSEILPKLVPTPSLRNFVDVIKILTIETDRIHVNLNQCLWDPFFQTIFQSANLQTINQTFDKISNLSKIIKQSPFNRRTFQTSISHFYNSLIQKYYYESASQPQLIYLLTQIINQMNLFRIKIPVHVWDYFFLAYYQTTNYYPDKFIHKLLGKMQYKPTINTFNIILYGLATNTNITNRVKATSLIIGIMLELHHITPNHISYKSQFRAFINDGYIEGANNLSINHPNIFNGGNIESLNKILAELPKYNLGVKLREVLKFLMNKIMARFKMIPTIKTYEILLNQITQDCHIFEFISHGDHDDISVILWRLHRMKLIKNTTAYQNYIRVVQEKDRGSNQYRPKTPDP